MKFKEHYKPVCPTCKEQIIVKPSAFMRLFEQRQGFLYCPLCDVSLYGEFIDDQVKLESMEIIKHQTDQD